MYRRKAFLHWYLNEGMDEQSFEEAHDRMTHLIESYNHFENTQDSPSSCEETEMLINQNAAELIKRTSSTPESEFSAITESDYISEI